MFFSPFPLLDKRKVGGDSCYPQQLRQNTKHPSQFSHRITELTTLLGTNLKSGVTLEIRSHLKCFYCLTCMLYIMGYVWVFIDPLPGSGRIIW